LAVAVAWHDGAGLLAMASMIILIGAEILGCINTLPYFLSCNIIVMTASATRMLILMLILLEVVDLLVLTVCCSHGLLPVSDPILEEYTATLKI